MIRYVIKRDGKNQVLEDTKDVLNKIAEFKRNNPSADYELSLESPNKPGDMTWTIKLDVNNGKSKEKILTERAGAH